MPKQSAGILLYRIAPGGPEVLLVHPGGPLWAKRDLGAWSIPKGEYEQGEDPRACAAREFEEELGVPLPAEAMAELGSVRQRSGKNVTGFAAQGDLDPARAHSNTFTIEWPPRSGTIREFPEIDRAQWFAFDQAREKLVPAQAEFVDRLEQLLRNGGCAAPVTRSGARPPRRRAACYNARVQLTSAAFVDGASIPTRHTCDGEDVSPPLAWTDVPDAAGSLALLVDDPDAPGGAFTHWTVWGLDPAGRGLGEGEPGPLEGRNDFGMPGYRGPCPPPGKPHKYVFRLYALDGDLGLESGADRREFEQALEGRVLATAELTATYGRRGGN